MGQIGGQSGAGAGDAHTAEQILQTVTQDLKSLHQGWVVQLSQEVTKLQAEKDRLMSDIEKLQNYHNMLESRQLQALSQQQMAQQQLWAKQLAQILAHHLQATMVQQLHQIANTNQPTLVSPSPAGLPATNGHSESVHRLIASLDATFSTTFKTLQQELTSYQSSLSQQINRMHSLEQQGEAILEALVSQLREQLQAETARSTVTPPPLQENGHTRAGADHRPSPYPTAQSVPTASIPIPVPGTPKPLPDQPKKEISGFQAGLLLVLLSTIALSVHNVVVRVIGSGRFNPISKVFELQPATIFGMFDVGGFIKLNVGNSLLTLWLRMLVVLPLMVPVAMVLYPPVWKDIKKFLMDRDRGPLMSVVGSGMFLFLSQILTYIAIGQIGPGAAVTILFMYPIVTVPLAWFLFNDRPTRLRWAVMATISCGVILTALPKIDPSKVASGTGVITAVIAGIAFAFYLIFMQLGFKKLHPVPVSLIQFFTIFILSSCILLLPLDLGVQVAQPSGFILGTILLGVLTLIGYLANNFGVRFMGAARASIIASSGPVMTALLALLIIQDRLERIQGVGIMLVTLGVAALSFERMKIQTATAKPAK